MSGDCFGQSEIWTTGFWTGADAGDITEAGLTQAAVDAVAARWQTFFTGETGGISNQYRTTFVKGALWHDDLALGKHVVGDPVYHSYGSAIVGFSNTPPMPPQISLAASFKSGYKNGPASNGRMYLPGVNGAVQNNGRVTDSFRDAVCGAFLTFVNGVNTDLVPLDAGKMILVGEGHLLPLPATPDRNAYITKVRLGNVYDTQRRRRNGIKEAYKELGVA